MSMLAKVEKAVNALEAAVKSKNEKEIKECLAQLLTEAKDPLSDWLDEKQGHEVSEHSIFNSLSRYWEDAFHKDMEALNVGLFYYT